MRRSWRHYRQGGDANGRKTDKSTGVHTGTPYDDVFRTLINDCSSLLIPLINEVFGEKFTGNEEIVFSPDIHYLNQQDGREDKRITDTSFSIIGAYVKKYLFECQTNPDSSMLVRIFEYSTQIALDDGRMIVNHLDHLEYLGQLSAYFKKTLIDMSEKVVDNLAANYGAVKEGVRTIMGGQILEYEAKTILRQGQMEALVQNVQALMETMNWTAEQAMDRLKVPKEKREAVYAKL